jgi:hypothetical protein
MGTPPLQNPRHTPVPRDLGIWCSEIERWHRSLKSECIRPGVPLSLDDARRLVERYVRHDNEIRLHSAIGYITRATELAGHDEAVFAERRRKLAAAKARREKARTAARILAPPVDAGKPLLSPLREPTIEDGLGGE